VSRPPLDPKGHKLIEVRVRCTRAQARKVKAEAARRGIPYAQLVRELIDRWPEPAEDRP
jgi:predicted DNA binding CopG/RHH family protein